MLGYFLGTAIALDLTTARFEGLQAHYLWLDLNKPVTVLSKQYLKPFGLNPSSFLRKNVTFWGKTFETIPAEINLSVQNMSRPANVLVLVEDVEQLSLHQSFAIISYPQIQAFAQGLNLFDFKTLRLEEEGRELMSTGRRLPASPELKVRGYLRPGLRNKTAYESEMSFEVRLQPVARKLEVTIDLFKGLVQVACGSLFTGCFKKHPPFLAYLVSEQGVLEFWVDPRELTLVRDTIRVPLSLVNNYGRLYVREAVLASEDHGLLYGWLLVVLTVGTIAFLCREELVFIDKVGRVLFKGLCSEDERYRIQLHLLELS